MKKIRSHQGYKQVDLYPSQRTCPVCGHSLFEKYRQHRFVVRLDGMHKLVKHVLACRSPECGGFDIKYRPESEAAFTLPKYTFGLDVVARIGELRYREHQTIEKIADRLNNEGVKISVKEIQLLSEVYLALIETSVKNDSSFPGQLRAQGGIVLAVDGVQPEKGNETLWLLRDHLSGRILLARNLLSSGNVELAPLLKEVKEIGAPIIGVISDKQSSICLAVEKELPGVEHQLCQYHYLRDMAKPVNEADRKLKKELKQKVRGMRALERQVAHKQDDESRVVRGYCVAIREVMRDDGKYPLEPAGITLYDKLKQIDDSLERAVERRSSSKLQRLRTILQCLGAMTKEYAKLVIAWSWVHHVAQLLDKGQTRDEAESKLLEYADNLPQDGDSWLNETATHIGKLTKAFAPKLFAFFTQPLLPRTNNDLELFIGEMKKQRRQMTGRKETGAFILREGAVFALLLSLSSEMIQQMNFASIDIEYFQRTLTDLRRSDERSQAWRARRDLKVYLAHLEQDWKPPT